MINMNQFAKIACGVSIQNSRGLVMPLGRFNFTNIKNYAMKDQKKKIENYDTYNKQFSGSVEQISKKRHQQHKYLELEADKKKDLDIFIEAYSDTVIEFKLYGDHYDYKTQTIDAVLNYYQIAYQRIFCIFSLVIQLFQTDKILLRQDKQIYSFIFIQMFNPLYHLRIQAQFGDQIKDLKISIIKLTLKQNKYPLLRINISLEPAQFLELEKVEQWLIDHDFMILPKHRTHSAWAQQGVEFAQKQFQDSLNKLFWSPTLTFELYWKSHAKSYTEYSKRALALTVAKIQGKQILKNVWGNLKNIRKDIDGYKQSREEVLKLVDVWKGRLEENDFHGGMHPDEADFAMYGVLMAKYNSRSFQKFIENHWPASVRRWFIRMQQSCYFEKRNLYN